MPELPEVETTRRGIEPHVVGRVIKWAVIREPRLRWLVADSLAQSIIGQTFDAVKRRAKYLLLCSEQGRLMLHLGMSGSLRVLTDQVAPEKHDHIDIGFEGGTMLRYRDPRRFCSIFWLPGYESHFLLDHLGPEPLSEEFSGEYLYVVSRRRRVAIKTFIMNSRVVVGVGNIYANEASVNIYDLMGKMILSKKNVVSWPIKISTSEWASGFYIIDINNKGYCEKKRLVIE